MKKANQKGFSAMETILLLFVLAALIFVGYVVYLKNLPKQATNQTSTSESDNELSAKTYTDTAKKFTLRYPVNWEAFNPETGGRDYGEGEEIPPTPDWSVTSRDVSFKPPEGHKDNNIRVMADCTAEYIAEQKANKDQFHTITDLKINGYDAVYDKLEFKGDAETYVNHTYYVLSGSSCLSFDFRESHHHDMSGTNFDDKKNLVGFESIVKSVKFTR